MTNKECAKFYLNFYTIGRLSKEAGLSYQDAVLMITPDDDQYPPGFYKQFYEAVVSGDFTHFNTTRAGLTELYPGLVFARRYLQMFIEVDNSAFALFGEASILFAITEAVKKGAKVTPEMQKYIGYTYASAASASEADSVRQYLASINPELLTLWKSDGESPLITITEIFRDVNSEKATLPAQVIVSLENMYGGSEMLEKQTDLIATELGMMKAVLATM
jgi:hypothetical protein